MVAYITVPNMEVGKKLAHHLVASKLAACVNIMPKVVSVFEWEGKTEEDTEELLMVWLLIPFTIATLCNHHPLVRRRA